MTNENKSIKGIRLDALTEIRVDRKGQTEAFRPGLGRCQLYGNGGCLFGIPIQELLAALLYGDTRMSLDAVISASFSGEKKIDIRRQGSHGQVILSINGNQQKLGQQSPGLFLFGVNRTTFVRNVDIDARDAIVAAGSSSLQESLRTLLLPNALPKKTPLPEMARTDDLAKVQAKRRILEREYAALPQEDGPLPFEAVDPPAMGELIEALEETRLVEKRMLDRRLELGAALQQATAVGQKAGIPPVSSLLDELEEKARALENNQNELTQLRNESNQPTSFLTKTGIIIGLIVSTGLGGAGIQLDETALVQFGVGIAGLTTVSVIGLWLVRMNRIVATTRAAKTLRMQRGNLKEEARQTCLRVGAMADFEDITPAAIRSVVDRAASRNIGRVLKETLAPFVDQPAEINIVKRLAKILEMPLTTAGRSDDKIPAVPLVRVTQSVLNLAGQWNQALGTCAERVEAAVTDKVRNQIERELLENSLEKLRATERTLELNSIKKSSVPGDTATAKAATALNLKILPLLVRRLGKQAPSKFAADLKPEFSSEPTSEVNSFIRSCVLVSGLGEPSMHINSIGRFLRDPGFIVGPSLEEAFIAALTTSPQFGRVNLVHSRPELEQAFIRMASPAFPALVNRVEKEEALELSTAEEVYSSHVDRNAASALTADLLR